MPRRVTPAQLFGASVVALLAVAALIYFGSSQSGAPAASASARPPVAQSGQVRGIATAPVTIDEWADFQCPACGLFARGTEPQLLSTYITKGQVKLVFHNFAFLGQESLAAANAAQCAGAEGKFWEYHDKLYASQQGENQGAFSIANLKKFGSDLGLGPTFATCVDSGRYMQTVRDEQKTGVGLGVQATPTLFINGKKYEGALSFDQLKAIVDPLVGR